MHFQVALIDEALVAIWALDFHLGFVETDNVEFQRAWSLAELTTNFATEKNHTY